LARLRFNDEVEQIDVDEALRLIDVSRKTINEDDKQEKMIYNKRNDDISSVFLLIRELCNANKEKTAKISDIEKKLSSRNLLKYLDNTLVEYTNLGVIYVNESRTEVTLI
jgi:DNA replication licensing factor MCM7